MKDNEINKGHLSYFLFTRRTLCSKIYMQLFVCHRVADPLVLKSPGISIHLQVTSESCVGDINRPPEMSNIMGSILSNFRSFISLRQFKCGEEVWKGEGVGCRRA